MIQCVIGWNIDIYQSSTLYLDAHLGERGKERDCDEWENGETKTSRSHTQAMLEFPSPRLSASKTTLRTIMGFLRFRIFISKYSCCCCSWPTWWACNALRVTSWLCADRKMVDPFVFRPILCFSYCAVYCIRVCSSIEFVNLHLIHFLLDVHWFWWWGTNSAGARVLLFVFSATIFDKTMMIPKIWFQLSTARSLSNNFFFKFLFLFRVKGKYFNFTLSHSYSFYVIG